MTLLSKAAESCEAATVLNATVLNSKYCGTTPIVRPEGAQPGRKPPPRPGPGRVRTVHRHHTGRATPTVSPAHGHLLACPASDHAAEGSRGCRARGLLER
jgi:hypothetical protein